MLAKTVGCLALVVLFLSCKKEPTVVPPQMIEAGPGENIKPMIAEARRKAESESVVLMVYVSATWCAPCQEFQASLQSGALNNVLPNLRFLKFDAQKDGERIDRAGYSSDFVPYIVIPNADGSPSSKRIEGAVVKGKSGTQAVVEKLHALLSS